MTLDLVFVPLTPCPAEYGENKLLYSLHQDIT